MNIASALLILACSGPMRGEELAGWARPQVVLASWGLDAALTEGAHRPGGSGESGAPPPCIGSTCQPRVSIPVSGFETRIDVRGKGGEFLASTLERMDAGIAATVARAVATAGVRVEFQPRRGDEVVTNRAKFRQVALMVRWRLEAWSGPVFEPPPTP